MAGNSAGSIFVDLLLKDSKYVEGIKRAKGTTSSFSSSARSDLSRLSGSFTSVLNPVNALSAAASSLAVVLAGAFSVQSIIRYSDVYRQLEGRLRIVTDGAGDLADKQQALFDIAQRTRQPLEEVISLYTRLSNSIEPSERASYDLLAVTENIAKALAVTGEGTAQAQAAILQFSQAVQSDFKGSAQEINSLLDSAPRLAQALQRSFGDGTTSLKQLAEQGLLSRDAVLKALSDISGQAQLIGEDFDKTSLTVGQAMTRLENSFLRFIGQSDGVSTSTSFIAREIADLANDFDRLSNAIDFAKHRFDVFMGARATAVDPNRLKEVIGVPFNEFSPAQVQAAIDRSTAIETEKLEKARIEADKEAKKRAKEMEREGKAAAKRMEAEAKRSQEELNNLYNSNREAITGLDSATIKYYDTVADLDKLVGAGIISQEEYGEALVRLQDELEKSSEKASIWGADFTDVGKDAARNIQSSFADFLFDPFEDGLGGMLKGFSDTLRRMVAEAASANILKGLFGDTGTGGLLGGAIGSFFGGSSGPSQQPLQFNTPYFDGMFADGGYIKPGHWGIAGEAGAEAIYGGKTGATVIPQGGSGMTVNIINNNGSRVSQRPGTNGASLDVMIDEAVAANIGTPGSRTNSALGAFTSRGLTRR